MPDFTTTTRLGLRWLRGTNLISDIDAGFQALAEDVDAKLGPSAWTPLALPTHITTDAAPNQAAARIVGDRVELRGALYADGTGVIAAAAIATMPTNCTPSAARYMPTSVPPATPGTVKADGIYADETSADLSLFSGSAFISESALLDGLSFPL